MSTNGFISRFFIVANREKITRIGNKIGCFGSSKSKMLANVSTQPIMLSFAKVSEYIGGGLVSVCADNSAEGLVFYCLQGV